MTYDFLTGSILAVGVSAFAYKRGSLSLSGFVSAVVTGTIIFSIGGLSWAVLLITFFFTSSALSHYKENVKEALAEKFQKGNRRDIGQVIANGGWGAVIALVFAFYPEPVLFAAFVGTVASVNADTWATELGVLSSAAPRLITSGRVAAVGTSGAITLFGTFAAFCGAFLIGIVAFASVLTAKLIFSTDVFDSPASLILIATVSGLSGSLFDSVLGATVQGIYYCDFDQKETESDFHRCGHATRLIRGWRWLDNDLVNFIASVFASIAATGIYWLMKLY